MFRQKTNRNVQCKPKETNEVQWLTKQVHEETYDQTFAYIKFNLLHIHFLIFITKHILYREKITIEKGIGINKFKQKQ